jgi:hypothetical protein
MYWKDIPAQVKAQDEAGVQKAALTSRFNEAIDAAAMADGSAGSDAYLEGWNWGPQQEREGSAQEVAAAIAAELEAEYSKEKLKEMILSHKA